MEKRLVTVKYIFEGKQLDRENEPGVLLPNNRVFVTKDFMSIYDAIETDDPNLYIVDLDVNPKDYFAEQGNDFLINLIVA